MEASTSNIEEWVVDYREFIIATEYDAFGLTRSGCLIHNPLANSMIELPDEQHRFQQIAASDNFFLGLTKKGEVIYWGRHHYAHPDGKTRPIKVEPYQGKCRFTQVACSSTTCAAIDDNGRLYFWGNNVNNRLRLNNIFEKEYCVYIPVLFSTGLLFSSIAVGNDHRIGITNVFIWGKNDFYQLGEFNDRSAEQVSPVFCKTETKAKKVCCGAYHSLILLENGDLYVIGNPKPPDAASDTKLPENERSLRLLSKNAKDMEGWRDSTAIVLRCPPVPPRTSRLSRLSIGSQKGEISPRLSIGNQRKESTPLKQSNIARAANTNGEPKFRAKSTPNGVQISMGPKNPTKLSNHRLPLANATVFIIDECNWISFGGSQIHIGYKHYDTSNRPLHQNVFLRRSKTLPNPTYRFNWLHSVTIQGDVGPLEKYEGTLDFEVIDAKGTTPFEIAVVQRNRPIFQFMVATQKKKYSDQVKLKLRSKVFLQAFGWLHSDDHVNFEDLIDAISDESLLRGILRVLRTDSLGTENDRALLTSLKKRGLENMSTLLLHDLSCLSKHLHHEFLFDWFLTIHRSNSGDATTHIFLRYLRLKAIQNAKKFACDYLIPQVWSFFKTSIQISAECLNVAMEHNLPALRTIGYVEKRTDPKPEEVFFMAALLSNGEAQKYVLKHMNLEAIVDSMTAPQKLDNWRKVMMLFTPPIGQCTNITEKGQFQMGKFYQVVHENRACIQKTFTELRDLLQQQAFVREVLITRILQHSNIVRSIALSTEPNINLIYEEYSSFRDVFGMLKNSPRKRIELILKVATGIQYLHQNGIIHKDIKQANILVHTLGKLDDLLKESQIGVTESERQKKIEELIGKSPLVKIIDFGTCKIKKGLSSITRADDNGYSHLLYPLPERKPQQSLGEEDITPAVDVFLFGQTITDELFSCMKRDAPTRDENHPASIQFGTEEQLKLSEMFGPQVAAMLMNLIQNCTRTVPARRPPIELVVDRLIEMLRLMI